MKTNIKTSPINNCVLELFKGFYDPVKKRYCFTEDMPPELVLLIDKNSKKKHKVVYLKSVELCPVCGSKLNNNGTDEFLLNKIREIRKQKYVCKDKECKSHTIASLEKFIDKHCNYTRILREFSLSIGLIDHLSYGKLSELMELVEDIRLPRSTVHYHEKTVAEDYLAKKEKEIAKMLKELGIEPEGVYHYDEQVLWVNTHLKLRMTIIDASNNLIINEIVVDSEDFDKNTIKKFLKGSLKGLKLKAIVTDGHQAYPSIIEALKAIHQKCVFHKMQNLMKRVSKTIRKSRRKITTNEEKIEKNNQKISELKEKNQGKRGRIRKNDKKRQKFSSRIKKLDKENRELRNEIRKHKAKIKELQKYVDDISLMFKSKSKKTAMKRFQKLNEKIDEKPEEIASFIKKLNKDIDSTLNHIIHDDIPNTNNKIEGYYKITLPRHLKRKFRTDEGLDIRLRLNRIRWTERNVIKMAM